MARSLPEWVGKTDDAKVPPRVRARIFDREGGRCWISGRKIASGEPWQLDHKIALINGGRHAESNLFPALSDKHREKTDVDMAEKSHIASVRGKHIGAKRPKARIAGRPRKLPKNPASAPLAKALPPRTSLFVGARP